MFFFLYADSRLTTSLVGCYGTSYWGHPVQSNLNIMKSWKQRFYFQLIQSFKISWNIWGLVMLSSVNVIKFKKQSNSNCHRLLENKYRCNGWNIGWNILVAMTALWVFKKKLLQGWYLYDLIARLPVNTPQTLIYSFRFHHISTMGDILSLILFRLIIFFWKSCR